jgi:ADP-ribose pyrophosphatase
MDANDVEILERRREYRGFLRLDALRLRHRLFAGGWSEPMSRELVVRGAAVGVLLYDPARAAVVLIEQFRVGALGAGFAPWMTEVVAGLVEPGEAPEAVARREAREEAGATLAELVALPHYVVSPGCSDETVRLFCARVDSRAVGGVHGRADEHEDIRVLVLPLDEALARCADGRIASSLTLIALYWLALHRVELDRRWLDAPRRDA